MDKLNKIQGVLIGGAIGDAVGFIVEKSPILVIKNFVEEFKQEQFLIKNRTYPQVYEFGQYSDDTQFSKLLINSVLEKKSFKELLVENYQSNKLVGLGKNTTTLLKIYEKNQEASPDLLANISNGGVMRSWPIGLLFEDSDIKTMSEKHSSITHNTEESIVCCEFVARLMNLEMQGTSITESSVLGLAPNLIRDQLDLALKTKDSEELRNLLIYGPLAHWEGVPPLAIQTTIGSVVSLLRTNSDDFKTSIAYGLSLGGDTDSVCSIIGAIKGSRGLDKINPFLRNIIHDNGDYKEDFFLELGLKIDNFTKKT